MVNFVIYGQKKRKQKFYGNDVINTCNQLEGTSDGNHKFSDDCKNIPENLQDIPTQCEIDIYSEQKCYRCSRCKILNNNIDTTDDDGNETSIYKATNFKCKEKLSIDSDIDYCLNGTQNLLIIKNFHVNVFVTKNWNYLKGRYENMEICGYNPKTKEFHPTISEYDQKLHLERIENDKLEKEKEKNTTPDKLINILETEPDIKIGLKNANDNYITLFDGYWTENNPLKSTFDYKQWYKGFRNDEGKLVFK